MKKINFTIDSRKVKKGDTFIALKGDVSDGHQYVEQALLNGAKKCVVQKGYPKKKITDKIELVKDTHFFYSRKCASYFNYPSKKLTNIGITGTNGKTTISFLLEKILKDAKKRTGLVGTIHYKVAEKRFSADRTTPDAFTLNKLLYLMNQKRVQYSIMEVSSHALIQQRTGHIFYDIALFTNLTPEHLDYHKDMDTYFSAKKKIFENLKKTGKAVVNIDNTRGQKLKNILKKRCVTCAIDKKADIKAEGLLINMNGLKFDLYVFKNKYKVCSSLIGRHNVYNILSAIAAAHLLGVEIKSILKSIRIAKAPAGRLESINSQKGYKVFVDYAHTSDALENVLKSLKELKTRNIITVFGCGGDRDRSKRPLMGKIACKYSDKVIVTSDNPRTEDPKQIIQDIEKGIKRYKKKYTVEVDRRKAINKALSWARKGSIVLIAGKGHEKYQILGNKKLKFDDVKVVKELNVQSI